MTRMLCIDPGPTHSGFALFEDGHPVGYGTFGKVVNAEVLHHVKLAASDSHIVVCERIASYGMRVGREVFETAEFCGRLQQAYIDRGGCDWNWIYRADVKMELCGRTAGANDAAIRIAICDLYGGVKAAKGTKRKPGPLYGVAGDVWSAIAVGLAFERMRARAESKTAP